MLETPLLGLKWLKNLTNGLNMFEMTYVYVGNGLNI